MTVTLAAIVAAGIVLPHILRLQRAVPVTAVMLWLSSLALRALASVLAVIFLLFFLPRTEVFDSLTHWCVHSVPGLADDLDVEGHRMGDLTLFVPGVALVVSLALAVCVPPEAPKQPGACWQPTCSGVDRRTASSSADGRSSSPSRA